MAKLFNLINLFKKTNLDYQKYFLIKVMLILKNYGILNLI